MVVLFLSALFQELEILRYFRNHGHQRNFIYNIESIYSFLAVTDKMSKGVHSGVRKCHFTHTGIKFLGNKNGEKLFVNGEKVFGLTDRIFDCAN